ncbi:hypothetical protein [Pseudomarimonas arenosa]|uniref:Uncharacterized protein n=1 Tax=Pseudomarimonas arenosa TaxID=2774145 RepID=A0AAW3ZPA5_9GAMM|nr:hypothetical protein [Pseudomarimonas arenosa]MBD8527345.1 hypothetical protein [Pseudomarimonas arenosa]
MNPITTIPGPSQFEAVQRLDANRVNNPREGSDDAREDQQLRSERPASSVVSLSDAARELSANELSASETVQGSNASSQADNQAQSRPATDLQERRGLLVNEQA